MRPFFAFSEKTPGKSKLPHYGPFLFSNKNPRNKKGLLLWTYIIIFLTIVMIIFFIQTVFGAVDENIRTSSRINAEQIASIINILESSPIATDYTFSLPNTDCLIKIDHRSVVFIKPNSDALKDPNNIDLNNCNEKECFSVDFIKTSTPVTIDKITKCSEKTLSLARCNGRIIKGLVRDC